MSFEPKRRFCENCGRRRKIANLLELKVLSGRASKWQCKPEDAAMCQLIRLKNLDGKLSINRN